MCGYTLGSQSVTYCFWGYSDLTLSSDPSFRKTVSRAYILYCFKVGIPNLEVRVPECPVLVGVTFNLTSGTSPILLAVGIPNLVCGYILGL